MIKTFEFSEISFIPPAKLYDASPLTILLELENKRVQLNQKLSNSFSTRKRLTVLYSFYDQLLDEEDKNLTTSYVVEFIEQYIDNLRNFDPTGINPALTKKIIKQ